MFYKKIQSKNNNAGMKPLPFVTILLVLNHIASYGSRVTVTLFAIDMKVSTFTIGVLMALYALLPALTSVSTGRWIDRIGVEKPFRVGSIAVGTGTLLPFVWPSIWMLYATAIIVGMGFMLINVAAYHAVGEMSAPEDRPVNFSYIALGFSTSSFIAPILSGVAIDSFGHRYTFLLLALFTVLPITALGFKLLPMHRAHAREHEPVKGKVFDLLKDREMRKLFIAMTLLTLAWDVYGFAIPLHGTHIGLSASAIGIVMGTFAAATFTVRLAMPFLVSRVSPWGLIRFALVLAALAFAAIPFTTHVALLMVAMFALGLALGSPQPMVLTLLHESAPHGRAGEALGLRTTLINTSQTVMPMVFGIVGAALGLMPLFFAMAALLAGGGAFVPPKSHQQRRLQQREGEAARNESD
jgi:predicted MFS family arabinose efflux permease